jgi:hypothetical protein
LTFAQKIPDPKNKNLKYCGKELFYLQQQAGASRQLCYCLITSTGSKPIDDWM